MTTYRTEQDSMGSLEVPQDALYGAQTQRAVNNFPISNRSMPVAFIRALLLVKAAAARANANLGLMPEEMAEAIVGSARQLLADPAMMTHFPVDVFQTGSGTSTNMNANEVLATLAAQALNTDVHPNDHVNCSQSSNDVIPTTLHVSAAVTLDKELIPALHHLENTIREKAKAIGDHVKTGRTHLMDAMPVSLEKTLTAWADQVKESLQMINHLQPSLRRLAQGGTAVGTGINAHPEFAREFNLQLTQLTGMTFEPADNFFTRIGSQDVAVALSGQLKTTAVMLMKLANDLRWMNSGPLSGLGEIELQALQPGSSIMPGKVNPVIPEAVAMVSARVIGNDATVTVAGQSGNFELNVMLPVMAEALLDSIQLMAAASRKLADSAIATFTVNNANLNKALAMNPILVTALNPIIGYQKAAEIAKQAYQQQRPIIEVAVEQTDLDEEELQRLLDPAKLTQGGISS